MKDCEFKRKRTIRSFGGSCGVSSFNEDRIKVGKDHEKMGSVGRSAIITLPVLLTDWHRNGDGLTCIDWLSSVVKHLNVISLSKRNKM